MPGTNDHYTVGEGISNILNTHPLDSDSFIADTSLENNSFHYNVNDETVWFRDKDGLNYNVTPVSRYSYSYQNKVNKDSIDHYINPLDQGTKVINVLFPMLR